MNEREAIAAVLAADASRANGDDAAIVHVPGAAACVTTDTCVDGVHLHHSMTAEQKGYRAAACALSDLAAMAAQPLAVVAAICVPPGGWPDVPAIAAGVEARAREAGAALVGGDLVSASESGPAPLSIAVTCIGSATANARGRPVLRSGAQPGDALYVTGTLGASRAGLLALERQPHDPAVDGYLRPPDRLAAARLLAPVVTAMMDLSDGIAADVPRLAAASGCGAVVELDRLPLDPALVRLLDDTGQDPLRMAAEGGDDYELLIAADPATERQLHERLQLLAGPPLPLTRIGRCADVGISWLRQGRPVADLQGFFHG